jgi:hypothetical protein
MEPKQFRVAIRSAINFALMFIAATAVFIDKDAYIGIIFFCFIVAYVFALMEKEI